MVKTRTPVMWTGMPAQKKGRIFSGMFVIYRQFLIKISFSVPGGIPVIVQFSRYKKSIMNSNP